MHGNLPLRAFGLGLLAAVLTVASRTEAFQIEQLTCLPPGCALAPGPRVSADGRTLLVRSTCDLDPGANPEGREQLFAFDLTARRMRQLTPARLPGRLGAAVACELAFAGDASAARVVLAATCVGPRLPRSGATQLLEYRGEPGVVRRLGPVNPCLMWPALSGDGQRLVVSAGCRPDRTVDGPARRHASRERLWIRDAPGTRFRRFRHPAIRRGCRTLVEAVSADGDVSLVTSTCNFEGGARTVEEVHFYRLLRNGTVERVDPAGCVVGNVGLVGDVPTIFYSPPGLSADGQTVTFGALDCGVVSGGNYHVFRRRAGGPLEQLTFGFCVMQEGDGISLSESARSVSSDGRTVAFGVTCDEFPVFGGDLTDKVFVQRDDGDPAMVELFTQPTALSGAPEGLPLSMDAAGTTLAFASSSTPTTCPANGARQLYVVRDLTDPTPRPAVCACSGG